MFFHTYPRSSQQDKHNISCRKQTIWHKKGLDICPLLTAVPLAHGHLTALYLLLCSASRIPVRLSPSSQNLNNLLVRFLPKAIGYFRVTDNMVLSGREGLPRPLFWNKAIAVFGKMCARVVGGIRVFTCMLAGKNFCISISKDTCTCAYTRTTVPVCLRDQHLQLLQLWGASSPIFSDAVKTFPHSLNEWRKLPCIASLSKHSHQLRKNLCCTSMLIHRAGWLETPSLLSVPCYAQWQFLAHRNGANKFCWSLCNKQALFEMLEENFIKLLGKEL